MGPHSESNGTLYWDGVPIMQGTMQMQEITVPMDALNPEALTLLEPMEFTMHIKVPKRWRCRGRKRFVKLLMSKGISRNQAGSVARVARIACVPYGELWQSYFFWG